MESTRNAQLPRLNLPALDPPPLLRGDQIKCLARRRFVKLEPEEWVRQHWLGWLSTGLNCPLGAMSVEHSLILNGMRRRADVLCQTPEGRPLLLLECKAPEVKLSQGALDQVWRYGLALRPSPPIIVLSNGLHHQAFQQNFGEAGPRAIQELPTYDELRRMTAKMP